MTKMTEEERQTALDDVTQGLIDDSRRRVEAAVARIRKGEPAVEASPAPTAVDAASVRRRDAERDARAEHVCQLLAAYNARDIPNQSDVSAATRAVAEEVSAIVRFPVVVFAVVVTRGPLAFTSVVFCGYPLPCYRHPMF